MTKNTIIAALLATTVMFSGSAAYAAQNGSEASATEKKVHMERKCAGEYKNKFNKRGGFGKEFMKQADTDGDGKVSEEEIKAVKEAKFKEADTNGDGTLSQAELETMKDTRKQAQKDKRFAMLDSNGDGQISKEELSNAEKGKGKGKGWKGKGEGKGWKGKKDCK